MSAFILCLMFCNPLEHQIAIAKAIVETQQDKQQSVVVAKEIQPPTRLETHTQQFKNERRSRLVRKKICHGRYCTYQYVREYYTVKVPVASAANKNWPSYPTTPRQQAWTQRGRHVTWRHLLEGDHKHHSFDPEWLRTRTQLEIEQIHSDSHEHCLKEQFIVTLGD